MVKATQKDHAQPDIVTALDTIPIVCPIGTKSIAADVYSHHLLSLIIHLPISYPTYSYI